MTDSGTTITSVQSGTGAAGKSRVVVVGIDGSTESRAALQWALDRAEGRDVTLHAVAVWHQPVQFVGEVPIPPGDFEAEARHWLAEAVPPAEPGATVRTFLEQGDPAQVLLEHARGAEMLVLGNHGHSALISALFGSVAQRCAHHAPCPVVLVPMPDGADAVVNP